MMVTSFAYTHECKGFCMQAGPVCSVASHAGGGKAHVQCSVTALGFLMHGEGRRTVGLGRVVRRRRVPWLRIATGLRVCAGVGVAITWRRSALRGVAWLIAWLRRRLRGDVDVYRLRRAPRLLGVSLGLLVGRILVLLIVSLRPRITDAPYVQWGSRSTSRAHG